MDANDRAEIRQMLTDVLSGHTEQMNGRFNVQHTELIHIKGEVLGLKEQVTIANGRTKKLETATEELRMNDLNHIANCPHAEKIALADIATQTRIRKLEDSSLSRKTIMGFTIKVVVLSGIIGGLVFTALNYFTKY